MSKLFVDYSDVGRVLTCNCSEYRLPDSSGLELTTSIIEGEDVVIIDVYQNSFKVKKSDGSIVHLANNHIKWLKFKEEKDLYKVYAKMKRGIHTGKLLEVVSGDFCGSVVKLPSGHFRRYDKDMFDIVNKKIEEVVAKDEYVESGKLLIDLGVDTGEYGFMVYFHRLGDTVFTNTLKDALKRADDDSGACDVYVRVATTKSAKTCNVVLSTSDVLK